MGKFAADTVLDALLEKIKDNAILMCGCSTQPTTRTEAVVTYMLATIAMGPGDYTIANGASGGRKLTVAAKSGIAIANNGQLAHIALVDNTTLYFVTTTGLQTLYAGNLLNLPSWTITDGDPL